jgi:transcriptional regulator with XRE-family HTH domain
MSTPVAAEIGENLSRIRRAAGLSLRQLAARLDEVGWPIGADGLNRVEMGKRQVPVGDLVALAVALDVSPATLLMPPACDRVQLTPAVETGWHAAWRWAVGELPLIRAGDLPIPATDTRLASYIQTNRPFESDLVSEVLWFVQKRLGAVAFTAELCCDEQGKARGSIRITGGDSDGQCE